MAFCICDRKHCSLRLSLTAALPRLLVSILQISSTERLRLSHLQISMACLARAAEALNTCAYLIEMSTSNVKGQLARLLQLHELQGRASVC